MRGVGEDPEYRCSSSSENFTRFPIRIGRIDVPTVDPVRVDANHLIGEPLRVHGHITDGNDLRRPPNLHSSPPPGLDLVRVIGSHVVDDEADVRVRPDVAIALPVRVGAADVDGVVGVEAEADRDQVGGVGGGDGGQAADLLGLEVGQLGGGEGHGGDGRSSSVVEVKRPGPVGGRRFGPGYAPPVIDGPYVVNIDMVTSRLGTAHSLMVR